MLSFWLRGGVQVINRCPFNGGWIRSCYGEEGLQRIGTHTVSCSGVTLGTRDAMLVYTYLVGQQMDPKVTQHPLADLVPSFPPSCADSTVASVTGAFSRSLVVGVGRCGTGKTPPRYGVATCHTRTTGPRTNYTSTSSTIVDQ